MSENLLSKKPIRGMVEIMPGVWITSASTPAEDISDWSKYVMTDEEKALADLKRNKVILRRELLTLRTNKETKLPGPWNKAEEHTLDQKLCNTFDVSPKDLEGNFIPEVRKYMHQDLIWDKTGISNADLKQFEQNCKTYAKKVLTGELIPCTESVAI